MGNFLNKVTTTIDDKISHIGKNSNKNTIHTTNRLLNPNLVEYIYNIEKLNSNISCNTQFKNNNFENTYTTVDEYINRAIEYLKQNIKCIEQFDKINAAKFKSQLSNIRRNNGLCEYVLNIVIQLNNDLQNYMMNNITISHLPTIEDLLSVVPPTNFDQSNVLQNSKKNKIYASLIIFNNCCKNYCKIPIEYFPTNCRRSFYDYNIYTDINSPHIQYRDLSQSLSTFIQPHSVSFALQYQIWRYVKKNNSNDSIEIEKMRNIYIESINITFNNAYSMTNNNNIKNSMENYKNNIILLINQSIDKMLTANIDDIEKNNITKKFDTLFDQSNLKTLISNSAKNIILGGAKPPAVNIGELNIYIKYLIILTIIVIIIYLAIFIIDGYLQKNNYTKNNYQKNNTIKNNYQLNNYNNFII